ncbi:MAG TPA: protein kinase [Planctomycetota bacterium]
MSDPSTRLGPYTLLGKLGAGGMGEVHLARDSRLGREVAIKLLPEALAGDEERRGRLMREARAAAALNHPNIATIHEVGAAEGRDYIAFEHIEGKSLAERLAERALTPEELLRLALALADALAYAHERGVIHRDVKPANVMLTARGEPKLLDFGLAKLAGGRAQEPGTELTQAGAIFGTPGAMSPEQAQGRPVDARSDVFSFGSLLFEMATRRPAFEGRSLADVLAAVMRDDPPPLRSLRPDLPAGLTRVVQRALRKDPDERYPTMRALESDLRAAAAARERSRGAPRLVRVVGALLALAAVAWLGWRVLRGGAAPPRAGGFAGASIGVIGFENLSDPRDAAGLVRMLVPLLTTDLAESGGLEVLSTARVRESLRRVLGPDAAFDPSYAREVARAAGAELMLIGDVAQERGGLRVVGELVDVASGRSLGSARAESPGVEDLFGVAATLCRAVRSQLGLDELAGAQPAFDAAAALTRSTPAWDRFVAGRLALHTGAYEEAVEHFRAALRVDETFALASFYLATALDWNGVAGGQESEVLERGLPHVARLPARWQVLYRAALKWSRDDWEGAHQDLEHVLEEPDVLPDALNLLGEIVEHDPRHWDPARARRAFERALEIDPTFEVVVFHLVDTLLLQDDGPALERLIADLRGRDPASPRAIQSELSAHVWHGRWEAARPLVDEALRRGLFFDWWFAAQVALGTGEIEQAFEQLDHGVATAGGFRVLWALQARGLAHLRRGRFAEALADLEAALLPMEGREYTDVVRAAVTFCIDRARLLELTGDVPGALAAARRATALVPQEARGHYWRVQLLARHGTPADVAAARSAFEEARRGSGNVSFPFWADLIEAETALQAGELVPARAALARAAAHPRETRDVPVQRWLEGRLAEAEGDLGAAIDAYAGVLPTYSWYVESHTQLEIESRVRRACLQQDRGDPDFDRAALAELVEAWGATDLELVADARRRLAR